MEVIAWINEVIAYVASRGLTGSDWLLMVCVLPIGYFLFVYGFLTKWWEDVFGWIILSGAFGLFAVLTSVIWSVFTGHRIDETIRTILYLAILISWIGKDVVLTHEIHLGRLERRRRRLRLSLGKETL